MSSSTTISIFPPADDQADKAVCKLCRRQFAKYTCPKCNVPYCSLTCFRGDAHSQCSEPFYKSELETAIEKEPSKTAEERNKMLQLLKRFEEESIDEEVLSEDDDDESELARRLASVDLESVSPDELWEMLTPAEKNKFLTAVGDPSSELAQQLLAREELQSEFSDPWWTSLPVVPSEDNGRYPPTVLDIPSSLLNPVKGRPLLAYNFAAIAITYAYIIRHLGVPSLAAISQDDDGPQEIFALISQFIPFLLDRKSTLVFPNLDAVITDLASRFHSSASPRDLLPALLQDAKRLTCPLDIVGLSPSSTASPDTLEVLSHPHQLPLLVLSDIKKYVCTGQGTRQVSRNLQHVAHKLVFYAAHLATMPTPLLRGLAHELQRKSDEMRQEVNPPSTSPVMKHVQPSQSMAGRIAQLPEGDRVTGDNL